MGFLGEIARGKDYPDRVSFEFLRQRNWILPNEVEIAIEKIPTYEALARSFLALKQKGASDSAIAAKYNTTRQFVSETIRFAKTGERPDWARGVKGRHKTRNHNDENGKKSPLYRQIGPLVVKFRDNYKLPFHEIRTKLRVDHGIEASEATIGRAYFAERSDLTKQAVERGGHLDSGAPQSTKRRKVESGIRRLIGKETSMAEIAKKVGCSVATVYRVRDKLASKRSVN